jgi:hypothetical protein
VISVDCGKKSDKGIENKVIETRHEEEELCVIDSIPVLFNFFIGDDACNDKSSRPWVEVHIF